MPSVATQIAEALTECRNLREALSKEVEERRRDHDKIIKLEEWYKNLFNRVKALEDKNGIREKEEKEQTLLQRVEDLEEKEKARGNEEKLDAKEKAKNWRSFGLKLLLEIGKLLAAAAIGGALGKKLMP